jgi:glycosyltransferase involved in cell wall biosynthesis
MTSSPQEATRPRRLLFLTPFAPRTDLHHGGRATAHLIGKIAERNRVALLCLRAANDPPVDQDLRERCEVVHEVVIPVAERGFAGRQAFRGRLLAGLVRGRPQWATHTYRSDYGSRLRQLAAEWKPDVIQLELRVMTQYLDVLEGIPARRVLVDHDPMGEANRGRAIANDRERLLQAADALAWRRLARRTRNALDAVVVFTADDERAVRRDGAGTHTVVIPLSFPIPQSPLDPIGVPPPRVLFIGGYVHAPNRDAAMRLLESIFPLVRREVPEAVLELVGDDPTETMRRLADEHVLVTGGVPSVTPYLSRAAVVIAPLRLGGGMRLKVMEALGAGKAVVASPLAVEGLALEDGTHALIRDRDEELAAATIRVLQDPRLRSALGTAGRLWASERVGDDAAVASYERLYDELVIREQVP